MSWLLVAFSCTGTEVAPVPTPSPPVPVEPAPVPAPPEAPAEPRCDSATLTPIVQVAEGIADEIRQKAQVQRPVCKDGFGYAMVGFGKEEDPAAVYFAHQEGAWKVIDLGTGIDCSDPPEPMTAEMCSGLEKAWSEQKKEGSE